MNKTTFALYFTHSHALIPTILMKLFFVDFKFNFKPTVSCIKFILKTNLINSFLTWHHFFFSNLAVIMLLITVCDEYLIQWIFPIIYDQVYDYRYTRAHERVSRKLYIHVNKSTYVLILWEVCFNFQPYSIPPIIGLREFSFS